MRLWWRQDVTFHEDATRMTHNTVRRAMATINNLVSNLLAIHGFSNFAQARRFFDARPLQAFAVILGLQESRDPSAALIQSLTILIGSGIYSPLWQSRSIALITIPASPTA